MLEKVKVKFGFSQTVAVLSWQALQHNDLALVLKMINFFWSEK